MEKKKSMFVEQSFTDHEIGDTNKNFDEDGRTKRTGKRFLLCRLIVILSLNTLYNIRYDTYNMNTICVYVTGK